MRNVVRAQISIKVVIEVLFRTILHLTTLLLISGHKLIEG